MKCGAISKGDSLSMGILFSCSTTKAINNRPAFLWMDDANRSGFPGNQSLTAVIVHMLPYKLQLREIPLKIESRVYVMPKTVVREVNKNTDTNPRRQQRAVSERQRVNISTSYLRKQGRGKQSYLCYLSFFYWLSSANHSTLW